ncbi:MAG: sulfotransferase family protein [Silicimonas sp.]|nr:sulfotransferase family protein [Silicimonas sp.]
MIVFPDQGMVVYAIPKTGTTALEAEMQDAPGAVVVSGAEKHMNVRQVERRPERVPELDRRDRWETMAVLRHPLERLASWYRYRRRLGPENAKSTASVSFDDFLNAMLQPEPPDYARIGDQWRFCTDGTGALGVTHLFAVEAPEPLDSFLRERTGQGWPENRRNVSAEADVTVSPETLEKLRAARKREFDLYDQVMQAGGHLYTP